MNIYIVCFAITVLVSSCFSQSEGHQSNDFSIIDFKDTLSVDVGQDVNNLELYDSIILEPNNFKMGVVFAKDKKMSSLDFLFFFR